MGMQGSPSRAARARAIGAASNGRPERAGRYRSVPFREAEDFVVWAVVTTGGRVIYRNRVEKSDETR